MAKKPFVYAIFHPSSTGPKNQEQPLSQLKTEALYMMHAQYKDKEKQGHNSEEDYHKWIAVLEILSQRGKFKNSQNFIKELKSKVKKPSFLSRLFRKSA